MIGITASAPDTDSIFGFEPENIDGEPVSLNKYKGKVILIVNTASECGYTPQYEGLQALYEKYKDRGLVVLGFPANDFGGQEPGTNKQIKQFCRVNYDVTFPMFSKISVKGASIDPLFEYLINRENPDFTGEIKWNFEKFIIDRDGNLIRRFRSAVKPQNNEIVNTIESALKS
ncbi:MAG: glutathione peroxidase [Balneolaceae bacterium]|nr:glutathione peroxidase [Balneolaceae bacterium]